MKPTFPFAILLTVLGSSPLFAAESGKIEANDVRAYAPLQGGRVTSAYGTFKNLTNQPLSIKLIKVAPFKAVELHETVEKDGRVGMEKVDSVEIPAKGVLELKPGGRHVMLFDPEQTVKEGETITGTFKVGSEEVPVQFKVVPRIKK